FPSIILIRRTPSFTLFPYTTLFRSPTAGLHFDDTLLQALDARGIERGHVTLHVGAGTFQPVRVDDLDQHRMHSEWLNVGARLVEDRKGTRLNSSHVKISYAVFCLKK